MATIPMLPYSKSVLNSHKIDQLAHRVIVFVIPGSGREGAQANEIRFPWNGELVDVYASCRIPGLSDTQLVIQKISASEFSTVADEDWVDVTSGLVLKTGQKTGDPAAVLLNTDIQANDHFRVKMNQPGEALEDITIEVTIKTNLMA